MKVLVAGAHGTTGRLVVGLLTDRGHEVRGMIRDAAQAELIRALGAAPFVADLTRADSLPEAVAGRDTVVFAAGSKGKDLDGVDRDGAMRLIDAAREGGARRFVMLSSFFAGRPDDGPQRIRAYLHAKHAADEYLRASGLDHTIVRPGWLTDDAGSGSVAVADHLADEAGSISRADVAETLVAVVDEPLTIGLAFEVITGPVPIWQAILSLR